MRAANINPSVRPPANKSNHYLLIGGLVAAASQMMGGCTTTTPATPEVEVDHYREVLVQTIPRGAYVERNNEYIGVAPIAVRVRTSEGGYPLGRVRITATDTPTGAHVWKELLRNEQVPEKMLMDIRPFLNPTPSLTF
jgi:hypothetical protein